MLKVKEMENELASYRRYPLNILLWSTSSLNQALILTWLSPGFKYWVINFKSKKPLGDVL